jgi:hypothetical protein
MMKEMTALLLASAWGWAQPAIAPPQLGFVVDGARAMRPAYGLAGNFILGPAVTGTVVTEAFSGLLGLLKTDSALAAFNAQGKLLASLDAGPGPALFAFSADSTSALAYIASSRALVAWRGNTFAPVSLDDPEAFADAVLAIALPTPFQASLLVQRNDTIWKLIFPLGRPGSPSESALTGVQAPLLALPTGDLVYREAGGIAIRRADASEVHIGASLPASFSLQQMSQDWVQLTCLNGSFAILTKRGREAIYRLPE